MKIITNIFLTLVIAVIMLFMSIFFPTYARDIIETILSAFGCDE